MSRRSFMISIFELSCTRLFSSSFENGQQTFNRPLFSLFLSSFGVKKNVLVSQKSSFILQSEYVTSTKNPIEMDTKWKNPLKILVHSPGCKAAANKNIIINPNKNNTNNRIILLE